MSAKCSSTLNRPGLQQLLADAKAGRFDLLVVEALDRLSRDQADVAELFKLVRFVDVGILTLSEGEISKLHIGLKGTVNALFLKDLADKTRRGLRGRVEKGKPGGGLSYGYDVAKGVDDNGEPVRGDGMIMRSTLHPIDRFFMQIRRLIMMLERPISTPSNDGRTWRGYSAYNPRIIQKLLDIYRVNYNYVAVGKDKRTPAMRLAWPWDR